MDKPDTSCMVVYPKRLKDCSRLQEIYDLRVRAWANSSMSGFVNEQFFPLGWKDRLDEKSVHWIIEEENKIVASSRLSILDDVRLIEEGFHHFELPNAKPFAFYSRLVVAPTHRNLGITHLMDRVRIEYLKTHKISFALAWADIDRINSLTRIGFKQLGILSFQYGTNPKIDTSPALILHLKDIAI